VRTFEEISGIFQDAHFRVCLRIFEWGAHLRTSQGTALDPVPSKRHGAHGLAAASGPQG
jgi:hypothetical protein